MGHFGETQKNFFPLFSWKLFYEIKKYIRHYSFEVENNEGKTLDLLKKHPGESRLDFVMKYKDFEGLTRYGDASSKGDFRLAIEKYLGRYTSSFDYCGYRLILKKFDALEYYRKREEAKLIEKRIIVESKCPSESSLKEGDDADT